MNNSTISCEQRLNESYQDMLLNDLAIKILNGLDQLETKPNSGKRWVWELI